jgi:hypothetical protein
MGATSRSGREIPAPICPVVRMAQSRMQRVDALFRVDGADLYVESIRWLGRTSAAVPKAARLPKGPAVFDGWSRTVTRVRDATRYGARIEVQNLPGCSPKLVEGVFLEVPVLGRTTIGSTRTSAGTVGESASPGSNLGPAAPYPMCSCGPSSIRGSVLDVLLVLRGIAGRESAIQAA